VSWEDGCVEFKYDVRFKWKVGRNCACAVKNRQNKQKAALDG